LGWLVIRGSAAVSVAVWLLAIELSGCAQFIDTEQARLCRSLLPVLDPSAERIDAQTKTTGRLPASEMTVTITYRAVGADAPPTAHRITCLFAPAGAGSAAGLQLGAAAQLADVVTDGGPISPLRLYLLKQNWVARGAAQAADPSPYSTLGRVPVVPRRFAIGLQNAVGALPLISIYALLAAAYSLIYGLTGRINLAFGELTILAGYGAFLGSEMVQGRGSAALTLAAALAVGLFTGISHGAAMGRWVLAPLAGRPGQHVLIATIGLSLFWSEFVRLTQGTANRWMEPMFNRPMALARNGDFVVTVTLMAIVVPIIAAVAAGGLWFVIRRTAFGRRWRSYADDPLAAEMMGANPSRLVFSTMVLAAGAAALAGVLTTFYYGGVGFSGGQLVGLKALVAAVIGGIGIVEGALIGGVVLGLAETIWSALFTIESRDVAIFVMLVLWLAVRGAGQGDPNTDRARTERLDDTRW
jgi:branched-chain amino acid transport system permease protein